VGWDQIRDVAPATREVLEDVGLVGWPKTSGSRGFHIYCRIQRRWTFTEVRRAAVALAREVERRVPDLATSKWWKEERHGVFLDYNQNAKEPTVASVYSVRPTADARVSTPLLWNEVPGCRPEDRHRAAAAGRARRSGGWHRRGLVPLPAPGKTSGPTRRRRSSVPLIEVARSGTQAEAMAGLERWKARHADVWPYLEPADALVDSMRGRSSTWTRIRLNLRHVPEGQRPPQEPLEVDYDPWADAKPPHDQS